MVASWESHLGTQVCLSFPSSLNTRRVLLHLTHQIRPGTVIFALKSESHGRQSVNWNCRMGFFCSEKPPKAWTMMSPPMYQAVTVFPMPTQDASSVWVLVSSHHKMPFQNICVQRPRLNVFNGILKNPSVPAQTSHTCHPFCKCVFSPFSSRRKIKR